MPDKHSKFTEVMVAVRQQKRALILVSCFVNLLLLVTAIYMLQIYDRVLTSGSLDTLLWLTVIALFAIAMYGILEQSRRLILSRSAGFIDSQLNAPVLQQHMAARLAGGPVEANVRDVSDLRNYYQSDAALAFLDSPWSVVFILFIWSLHPALGMIAVGGAFVLFIAALLNDLMTRNRQRAAAAQARAVNEEAIRMTAGGETIAPLGMAEAMFRRWQRRHEAARSEQQALGEKTTTVLSFTRSLRMGLQVVILGAGAYLVLGGQITSGSMIAASIILGRALAPIERSTAAWSRYVAARTARQRLETLFTALAAEPERLKLPRPKGHIEVEKLFYAAPEIRQPILKGLEFELEAGTICAIVGDSGAGKSTLCRLLVGAWKPASGTVRLDGAAVHTWDAEDLGRHIGYLPQTVEMFPGTVSENIARFRDCTDEEVIRAAKLAGVHEMILRLPDGYETDLGSDGNRISLGQRQRIGLARAVFGDPAFIVLDEPNSNLDGEGDQALLETLSNLKKLGCTVVIVSHRAKVLRAADKIAAMQDGQLVKFGDVAEFLKLSVGKGSVAPSQGGATATSQTVGLSGQARPTGTAAE